MPQASGEAQASPYVRRLDVPRLAAAAMLTAAIAGTGCVGIVGAARFIDREERRFAVSGTPSVTLSTFDGAIEIRQTDRQEVAVTVEKRASSKEAASRIE